MPHIRTIISLMYFLKFNRQQQIFSSLILFFINKQLYPPFGNPFICRRINFTQPFLAFSKSPTPQLTQQFITSHNHLRMQCHPFFAYSTIKLLPLWYILYLLHTILPIKPVPTPIFTLLKQAIASLLLSRPANHAP